ncbi:MAG: hypothetical protein KBD48_02365 [Candidatus Pacebacteria bacterium]|nr:hypothetical protein [Candidatus Paceibacterota bacterium]MBP9716011.1 hypothetical protein [Candidatus Paceibacterota bacterium]
MGKTVRRIKRVAKKKIGNTTKKPQDRILPIKGFTKKSKAKSIDDLLKSVVVVPDEVKKIQKKKADASRKRAKKYRRKPDLPEGLK